MRKMIVTALAIFGLCGCNEKEKQYPLHDIYMETRMIGRERGTIEKIKKTFYVERTTERVQAFSE